MIDQIELDIEITSPKAYEAAHRYLAEARDKRIRMSPQKRLERHFLAGCEILNAFAQGKKIPTRALEKAMKVPGCNHTTIFNCYKVAEHFKGDLKAFREWNSNPATSYESITECYKVIYANPLKLALSSARTPVEACILAANVLRKDLANPNKFDETAAKLLKVYNHLRSIIPPTDKLQQEYMLENTPCCCCGEPPLEKVHPLYGLKLYSQKVAVPMCDACRAANKPISYAIVAETYFNYAQHARNDLDLWLQRAEL